MHSEGVTVVCDGIDIYSNKRSHIIHSPTTYHITTGRGKKINVGAKKMHLTWQILGTSTKIRETLLMH